MRLFGKLIKFLSGIGVGHIPGVSIAYRLAWKYLGPKGTQMAEVDGFKLYVICRDYVVAPTMLFEHTWEPQETMLCKQHIGEGMTVVDIGAYIGYYSILASKLVGGRGKVYAFEPLPECQSLLHKNIQLNNCRNIGVFGVAITDKVAHTIFYLAPDNLSSSSITGKHPDLSIQVPTTMLDEVIGNEKVDFIKMDIEGSEVRAIKGMIKTIKNNPHLKMITELFPAKLIEAGSSLEEYISLLQSYFKLYIISGEGVTANEVGLREIQNMVRKTAAINLFCQRDM